MQETKFTKNVCLLAETQNNRRNFNDALNYFYCENGGDGYDWRQSKNKWGIYCAYIPRTCPLRRTRLCRRPPFPLNLVRHRSFDYLVAPFLYTTNWFQTSWGHRPNMNQNHKRFHWYLNVHLRAIFKTMFLDVNEIPIKYSIGYFAILSILLVAVLGCVYTYFNAKQLSISPIYAIGISAAAMQVSDAT